MDKWQRQSPQTRSPQCGCSHGSAGDFDTRGKKKNDRVQAQGERRRTIGFKRGLCNFRSLIYNDNNIGFL